MENTRQQVELSTIFKDYANDFLHSTKLTPNQRKAYKAIMDCRTAKMGGHQKQCNQCSHTLQAYNSCRNRHCPKCQFIKKAQWVDKLASNLPPVKHFHLVFTIPTCLHKTFYINQKVAYGLLFKAAGEALRQCGANTNYLGAETGAVAVLHTWGQTLMYHPHIHMIVPAGGMTEDQSEWIPSAEKFLLPVKALSARFRTLLCTYIEKALSKGEIKLPHDCDSFVKLKQKCYKTKWVVYSEKPFSKPDNVIKYLGNYTHRVAIANSRIIKYENGKVTFYYKDYKKAGARRVLVLEAREFIRRFLQHILPSGLSKVRYYGFLALRNIKTKLQACYSLFKTATYFPALEGLNAFEVLERVTGKDPFSCPKCIKGKLIPQKKKLSLYPS